MAFGLNSYLAIKKETTEATAVKPDVYVEALDVEIKPGYMHQVVSPVVATLEKNWRSVIDKNDAPRVTLKLAAEAKTLGYFLAATYGAPATTGPTDTSAYTHVFTPSTTVRTYTLDSASVDLAYARRVYGLRGGSIKISHDGPMAVADIELVGRGMFDVGRVTTTASSGTTLVINSTAGLTTSDTITVSFGDATNTGDYTIASVDSGIQLTLGATISGKTHTANDRVVIKKSTPSYSLGSFFNWPGAATFSIGTAIGSVAAADAEDFTFDFMRDIDTRHAITGTAETDRDPVANLSNGVAASTSYKWYHTDPKWVDYLRARSQLAASMSYTGLSLAGAASVYDSLLIQMANLRQDTDSLPKFAGDGTIEEEIAATCLYDSSAGYASKVTLVNAVSAY